MEGRERLEVVIVNYSSADMTIRCVESILRWRIAIPGNIIVVDNKSPDNSLSRLLARLSTIKVVAAEQNSGFGAGINLGVGLGEGEYILILNPDTYFERDTVSNVVSLMDAQPRIGITGLDLVDPDGARQFSARRFYSILDVAARRLPIGRYWPFRNRVDRHLMKEVWSLESCFEAEWVVGTGFLVRRHVFEEIGGMDEQYFLYMEDVDLCARVWKSGYQVVCVPGATLVHDHQRASALNPFSRASGQHILSLLRFARKFSLPLFRPPGIGRTIR
jgi:N-acetylglucosaminyl-diphospho-decaprenol L-rhamnosyltransferase